MTGWRAGWMVVPEELADDLAKLIEYNFSCVFEPVQRAAVAALAQGEPDVARLRTELQSTRRVLSERCAPCPVWRCPRPAARCTPSSAWTALPIRWTWPSAWWPRWAWAWPRGGLRPRGRWLAALVPCGERPQKLLAGVDRLASFVARHRPG
jgi:hypothetical protein